MDANENPGHLGECRAVITLIFFVVHIFADTLPWLQIIRDRRLSSIGPGGLLMD